MNDVIRAQPDRANQSVVTLSRVGGIAAVSTDAILLIGLAGLAIQQQGLGVRNWLIVLFQMNSGVGSLPSDPLRIFNPIDVAVLALVGLTFLGLWPTLSRRHRIWTGIGIAMPFAGIAVLFITGEWGRSAVMGAGLIVAVVMLVSQHNQKWLAITGLSANGLLLISDLGTGLLPGALLTVPISAGYLVLMSWYGWLAMSLLSAETKEPSITAT